MTEQFSLTRAMTTEEGVYGLILVSGVIAATGAAGSPAWKTLLFTVLTVAVFWLAHVYAGTVAMHGSRDAEGHPRSAREAFRASVRKARGMLAATVFPAIALLLGALGVLDDSASMWIALWVGVVILGALGYLAYRRKGASLGWRLAGAITTASFGIAIVIVKAIVTH